MEFNEKLQELRKRKGLTQEELAEALFVSRTAVSKWESGRGYPGIDSLKAISKYFSVSIDELLSGDEILEIAENDNKTKESTVRDLVFGLIDCAVSLLLFLPFFSQAENGSVKALSLLDISAVRTYLLSVYFAFVILSVALGVAILTLQAWRNSAWVKSKSIVSCVLSSIGVCLFIITRQPYAAVLIFMFLVIKALMLINRR